MASHFSAKFFRVYFWTLLTLVLGFFQEPWELLKIDEVLEQAMETPKRETAKHCQQEQNAHGKRRKGSNIDLEHVTTMECLAIKLNNR